MDKKQIEEFLNKPKTSPLFKNKGEAIKTIEAISSAAFIQDRKMTSDEYGKIKEATMYLQLNICK